MIQLSRSPTMAPGDDRPLLSVVIPTRDRAPVLAATLDALAIQTDLGGSFEVLVVDDGSSDATPEQLAAARYAFPLVVLRQPPRGPAAARNLAARQARAPRLLLLGDDTPPAPGALAAHHAVAPGRDLGVQGRIDWDPQLSITPVMRFLAPEGPQFYFKGLVDGEPIPYSALLGSNLSLPTRWLHEEPFDESFPGACFEDTELAYRFARRGFTTVYSERARCWHRHLYPTLDPFLARQRRAGQAARRAVQLHRALLGRTVLQPLLVGGGLSLGRFALRRLAGRGRPEDRWDLACRWAFLRGFLAGRC